MRVPRHLHVSVVAVIMALLGGLSVAQPNVGPRSSPQLAGSWVVNVTPAPSTGIPPFTSLASMTLDGRMVNVHPDVGISLGEWDRLPTGAYAVTFLGLIPQNGQVLMSKVRATIGVDATGNQFRGSFQTDISDGDGNLVMSFDGTVAGTRFNVEPL
jgi:hypothetical protein